MVMILFLSMLLLLLLFILTESRSTRSNLNIYVIFYVGLSIATLVVYSFELKSVWKIETLWGDSTYYWETAKYIKEGIPVNVFNFLYPLVLSYFYPSLFLARLFQVLMSLTSLVILRRIFVLIDKNVGHIKYFSFFAFLNMNMICTSVQLQKDNVVFFLTVVIIYVYLKLSRSRRIVALTLYSAFLILLVFLMTLIRVWLGLELAFILSLLILIAIIFKNRSGKEFGVHFLVYVPVLIIAIAFSLYFLAPRIEFIINSFKYVAEGGMLEIAGVNDRSPLAPLRFVFGPGLIRPIFPEVYFQYFTYTISYSYLVGTITWYINIALSLSMANFSRVKTVLQNPVNLLVLILVVSYVGMYSFSYGGASGMRQRIHVQLLSTFLLSQLVDRRQKAERFTVRIFLVLSAELIATLISL